MGLVLLPKSEKTAGIFSAPQRCLVSQRLVESPAIVEQLDVFKDLAARLIPGLVVPMVNDLVF